MSEARARAGARTRTKRWLLVILAVFAALAAAAMAIVWTADKSLDPLLTRMGEQRLTADPDALFPDEGMRVFVCGSSSPLATRDRAKACIGVLANGEMLLFDTGAGSWRNIEGWGIPSPRLTRVFLTHFHSDHIADLDEVNVQSWIFGRTQPLIVAGPLGVDRVVDGYNSAFALDYGYRNNYGTERHLPLAAAVMQSQPIEPGETGLTTVYSNGKLTVSAFNVDHRPVESAIGYRIDYGDRSVVISGDTRWTDNLREVSTNVDVLFQESQSLRLSQIMSRAAAQAGDERMEYMMEKAPDYHTHAEIFGEIAEQTGAQRVVMYHLAPPPDQLLIRRFFLAGMPDNVSLARDGLHFTLKPGTRDIEEGDFD